jgi:hypothetical protein
MNTRVVNRSRRGLLKASAALGGGLIFGAVTPGASRRSVSALITQGSSVLPAWVPSPGSIADVSLDTIAAHNPCPGGACATINGVAGQSTGVEQQSGLFDWSGMVYASGLGTLGSLVMTGGGHNGYLGNEVYAYDIANQHWSRLSDPWFMLFTDASGNYAGNEYGEYYADATATTTLQNQPCAAHAYDHQVYLPPNVGGAGSHGALITTRRSAISPTGGSRSTQTHIFDLAKKLWSRYAKNLPTSTLWYGTACYDGVRNRIWGLDAFGNLLYLDLATRQWTTIKVSGAIPYYGNLRLVPPLDILVYLRVYNQGGTMITYMRAIDPKTTATGWWTPAMSGPLPPQEGGCDWCPVVNAFVYYAGDGGHDAYVLRPPASDPLKGQWMWSKVTLSGSASKAQYGGVVHYSRFRYVAPVKCFLWLATNTSPVQAWRLPGT